MSSDETSDAMSAVHFRWRWGVQITRRISSLFRKGQRVREPPSKFEHSDRGPVRSDPHLKIARNIADKSFTSSTPTVYHVASSPAISDKAGAKTDKGKKRADPRPPKHTTFKSGSKSLRSRSIERWPSGPCRGTPSPVRVQGSAPKARRGSETILVQSNKIEGSSSQSSPTTAERPRARFAGFLTSISHGRPNKYSSSSPHGSSRVGIADPSSSNLRLPTPITTISRTTGARTQADHVTRRSEEALRYYRTGRPVDDDEDGGDSQLRGALPAGVRATIPSSLQRLSVLLLLTRI